MHRGTYAYACTPKHTQHTPRPPPHVQTHTRLHARARVGLSVCSVSVRRAFQLTRLLGVPRHVEVPHPYTYPRTHAQRDVYTGIST